MPDGRESGYSSSVSGSRPEEVARIEQRLAELPDEGPPIEWTPHYNGEVVVNGQVPTPPGPVITEPWWQEGQAPGWDQPDATTGIEVILASAVKPVRVTWLWRDRIPMGMITVVDGDPKLGKTTMVLDLIARVSSGRPMPGSSDPPVEGMCLVMSTEDSLDATIVPRLKAAGANLDRIILETGKSPFYLGGGVDYLEATIARYGVRCSMVDPLMGYLGPDVNSNRDQDVRQVLGPLARRMAELDSAIALIRHLNKSPTSNTLYRGGGSIGIVGAARATLLVGKDPKAAADDPNPRRIVVSNGGNVGPQPPAISFRLVAVPVDDLGPIVKLDWDTTPTGDTAADILRGSERREREQNDGSQTGMAMGWLAVILDQGAVPYEDIRVMASQEGISETILRRAREGMPDVGWKRHGFGKGSNVLWFRKGKEAPRPPDPKPKPIQGDLDL